MPWHEPASLRSLGRDGNDQSEIGRSATLGPARSAAEGVPPIRHAVGGLRPAWGSFNNRLTSGTGPESPGVSRFERAPKPNGNHHRPTHPRRQIDSQPLRRRAFWLLFGARPKSDPPKRAEPGGSTADSMSSTAPRPAGRNQALQQPTACHQQRPAQQGRTKRFNSRQHVINSACSAQPQSHNRVAAKTKKRGTRPRPNPRRSSTNGCQQLNPPDRRSPMLGFCGPARQEPAPMLFNSNHNQFVVLAPPSNHCPSSARSSSVICVTLPSGIAFCCTAC
ncbi:hypothetical protein MNJPNG_05185 [Cupriavidus oxalaticus]